MELLALLGTEAWSLGSYVSYVLPFLFLVVLLKLYGLGSSIWTLQSCPVDLTGKTAVVTGANTGIGKAVSCELARRGARVVLACRRLPEGQKALADIQKATGSKQLLLRELDLSSLASIHSFSQKLLQEEPHIHLLVNNAAVCGLPYKTLTSDGLELTFMTNYLGPFLLTNLLLKGLLQADSARVVNVSSFRHTYGFVDEQHLVGAGHPLEIHVAYDCTKLLLISFTKELAQRLQGTDSSKYMDIFLSITPNCFQEWLERNRVAACGLERLHLSHQQRSFWAPWPGVWLCGPSLPGHRALPHCIGLLDGARVLRPGLVEVAAPGHDGLTPVALPLSGPC
ncbi:retinol dehydrogenase 11-like isoform X3 [Dromiciops gliroides]|uniref:retinol dehydrogenase 11-like isoform X3 n=1 Tax=Dromiciops gliroides TaxID=33562 RepID=UPI001CC3F736|nr:retinol dehydrogenase 11-like isoform X3 [Dromiciops gliroides]